MNASRWREIERIYHDAAAMPLDQRASFLERECAPDPELRADVDSMLAADVEGFGFLETPAPAIAARAFAEAETLSPGHRLGRYEIVAFLGAGAVGEVYKSQDTRLNRTVAIKVVPAFGPDDTERRKRFLREARAISALNHPNIVTVHDILAQERNEDGHDALVMEYVDGCTLDEKIGTKGMPIEEALYYAIQIADALAAAHSAGIVHRDVKPGNIMIASGGSGPGTIKLLDFGLAKSQPGGRLDQTATATVPGIIAGTVAYMSPEQADGQPLDVRSDIFSFGSVFYEMLTGRQGFLGSSPASTLSAILRDNPAPLRSVRPGSPAELARIVERCLQKDRSARYPSGAELRKDLLACQKRLTASASPLRSALRRPRVAIPVLAWLILLLAAASWGALGLYWRHWVRTEALPEIARLTENEKAIAAYRLARKVDQHSPNEPELQRMRRDIWVPISISTEPPGAGILIRDYAADKNDWESLGKTPVENLRLPAGNFCVKVSKAGFDEVEGTVDAVLRTFRRTLHKSGTAPPGMVWVPVDTFEVPGTGNVKGAAFWIDKYEVTNRLFKEFVDRGGYRNRDHWKEAFVDSGRTLLWEHAMARFIDTTGQPGPATWELGAFAQGHAEDPVSGVSWYEAAAYADFAGKALPTIYHWAAAANFAHFSTILYVSNFRGPAPAPVGSYPGVGRYGTYDMAGNVSEWCQNRSGDLRWVRGGAWNDPDYMYSAPEAAAPLARDPARGFRCVKYTTPPPALTAAQDIHLAYDPAKTKPVGDDVFRTYRSLYSYDHTGLKSRVEWVDDSSPWWRRERVSFDAAYLNERVIAFLFLPRNAVPPYKTVLFFPGGSAMRDRTSDNLELRRLDFLIRRGYAVVYPVYRGMYERHLASAFSGPNGRRDLILQWVKDARRSIDYVESRGDLDHRNIAYYGASIGAVFGPIILAMEPRIKAGVLQGGGLDVSAAGEKLPGEAQSLNFLPRVKTPVLMLNGKADLLSPLEQSQIPMFRLIGTPEKDKRRVVFESGHSVPKPDVIKEVLPWLERYLGPVKPKEPGRT